MAKFYSTIQGCRGEATRLGTASSGIRASVQSWDGSVITRLEDVNGQTILSIDTTKNSSSNFGYRQFRGTVEEFTNFMTLVNSIGINKVIQILNNNESRQ